jgi:hypothetical protein
MICNSSGCDIHDYKVSPLWCAYQSELVTDARRLRALEALADRAALLQDYIDDVAHTPRPVKAKAPPPQPQPAGSRDDRKVRASRERGIQWQT